MNEMGAKQTTEIEFWLERQNRERLLNPSFQF